MKKQTWKKGDDVIITDEDEQQREGKVTYANQHVVKVQYFDKYGDHYEAKFRHSGECMSDPILKLSPKGEESPKAFAPAPKAKPKTEKDIKEEAELARYRVYVDWVVVSYLKTSLPTESEIRKGLARFFRNAGLESHHFAAAFRKLSTDIEDDEDLDDDN